MLSHYYNYFTITIFQLLAKNIVIVRTNCTYYIYVSEQELRKFNLGLGKHLRFSYQVRLKYLCCRQHI